MISCFFRERQQYTKRQIATKMNISLESTVDLLRKLKSYGVVKALRQSASIDFSDDNYEVSDVDIYSNSQLFVFDYVGVVTVGDIIFKVFPKYLKEDEHLTLSLTQVIRVIKHYNAKEQIISLANGIDDKSPFNLLAIMTFIIDDFVENGPYSNVKVIREINGEGEIDWDKTVNEIDPYIINNRPYYLELFTTNALDDDNDYFKRLHTCITAESLKTLRTEGLTELLSISGEVYYDGVINDFGNVDYILYRLSHEMNEQFSSRKQMLLKTMYAYISQTHNAEVLSTLSMYGTNSFNLVWEAVCAEVMGNALQTELCRLPIPIHETYLPRVNDTLIKLISVPVWTAFTHEGGRIRHQAHETLIPDTISIYPVEGGHCFAIFDAKYYNIQLSTDELCSHPGVGDVTKQYLYQLAYNDFILMHGFCKIVNAFLMPGDSDSLEILGEASMDIMRSVNANPALSDITVARLPASKMYSWYLTNTKIEIGTEFPTL